ncbi:BrnA antitoxin family protein [Vogesella fluminis]|uniref:BrnA antitoxin family protein n=1 Tax=Vogesella fluminis TaxID=1069161 RepID=UPI00362F0687
MPACRRGTARLSAEKAWRARRAEGPTKERITIRLSPDVVSAFRATGDGWQSRIDAALQTYLKEHKVA